MQHINKSLVATATATALLAALGAAVAQSSDAVDPMATPQQQVDVNAAGSGDHIYFFRDQGYSPETDPAAHLLLIKHEQWMPVTQRTTTTTTTVAQATTAPESTMAPMPPASDTLSTSTDDHAMSTEATPVLAPKADRN